MFGRGKAGGCAWITAGPKRPHLSVCPGHWLWCNGRGLRLEWTQEPQASSPFLTRIPWSLQNRDKRVTTLWVKAQHEGALPPPCIVRKDPRVPHTARRGA